MVKRKVWVRRWCIVVLCRRVDFLFFFSFNGKKGAGTNMKGTRDISYLFLLLCPICQGLFTPQLKLRLPILKQMPWVLESRFTHCLNPLSSVGCSDSSSSCILCILDILAHDGRCAGDLLQAAQLRDLKPGTILSTSPIKNLSARPRNLSETPHPHRPKTPTIFPSPEP